MTWDMNDLLRAATGRGPVTKTPGVDEPRGNDGASTAETSSSAEPERELSMNDLLRRAAGRGQLQPDKQASETTKPNDMFNELLRARSRREFSFGLPMSESSNDQTEDAT